MQTNQRISESVVPLDAVYPVSTSTTVSTGWVNVGNVLNIMAQIMVGVFGASATVDANLQQAQDGSGTGAKAITGKAITQLLQAGGNNRQALINAHSADLDVANGFCFVKLNITVGTAATVVAGTLFGGNGRFEDAELYAPAAVAQVV